MRALDADGLAEGAEHPPHTGQVVRAAVGQFVGGAETGQVDGDDVALGGQDVQDGLPGLPVVAYAVEEQQGFARAPALVGEGRRAGTRRGLDRERDPFGHADSLS